MKNYITLITVLTTLSLGASAHATAICMAPATDGLVTESAITVEPITAATSLADLAAAEPTVLDDNLLPSDLSDLTEAEFFDESDSAGLLSLQRPRPKPAVPVITCSLKNFYLNCDLGYTCVYHCKQRKGNNFIAWWAYADATGNSCPKTLKVPAK